MRCQYCKKALGITKLLKGQTFCSEEHRELYLNAQAAESFERLRASFAEPQPKKLKLEKAVPAPEPPQDRSAESETKPEATPAEAPEAEVLAEPPTRIADLGSAPPLPRQIAAPREAVEKSGASEAPSAPFLLEFPAPQQQPAAAPKSCAEEPISATIQWPASPMQEASIRTSPSLILDISPAPSRVETPPVAGQPTWLSVPQGYPPVVVSALATLVLDTNGAELIPMPMGDPHPGKGPVPTPQTGAIETPLRNPRLPSRQPDHRPAVELSISITRPPQAQACNPSWEPLQGSVSQPPELAGVLQPQGNVVRIVPFKRSQDFGPLPSFPFLAATNYLGTAPKELRVAPAAHLPTTILPLRTHHTARSTPRALTATLASRFAVESTRPLRCEPSSSGVASPWKEIEVTAQVPQIVTFADTVSIGLSLAKDAIPLARSSAPNFPPSVEAAAAVSSALPLLRLSKPSALAAPVMPRWSKAQPLQAHACRLPAPLSERQWALRTAYLHPSLASPLSLITWSQSLYVTIPAANPTSLSRPAPLAWNAKPGRVEALQPWALSRRGHKLIPLLPRASRAVWTPMAPIAASLRPTALQPIRPGNEGTAPPRLVAVRVQPASMPVLPPSSPSEMSSHTGLVAPGPYEIFKLASKDGECGTHWTVHELLAEASARMPLFATQRPAPAMALAPSSEKPWWHAIRPAETVGPIRTYPAIPRSAWSVTAGLPDVDPVLLAESEGYVSSAAPGGRHDSQVKYPAGPTGLQANDRTEGLRELRCT